MTELEIQKKALEAVGNWMKFEDFSWDEQPDNAGDWCIVHTYHRDSDPKSRDLGRRLEKTMRRFSEGAKPPVILTTFNHWGVGWINAIAVQVFSNPDRVEITEAFRHLCRHAMEDQDAE